MRRMTLLVLLLALLAIPLAAATDVSGKWSGSFKMATPDGESHDDSATLVLKQEGDKITGTGGPSDDQQWTITKGKVDGDSVYLEVPSPDGPVWIVTVKFVDGHLKGEAWAEMDGKKAGGALDLTKQ